MPKTLGSFRSNERANGRATAIDGTFCRTSNTALLRKVRDEDLETTTPGNANLPEGCQTFGSQILALQ
jgi:hypothetical protein